MAVVGDGYRAVMWARPGPSLTDERVFVTVHVSAGMGGSVTVGDLWREADDDKLAELLLYVAGRLQDDPRGGATKINKVLYFSEVSHIRTYGVPITGTPYQRLEHGPAPRQLRPLRDRLVENGDAELQTGSYFGRPLHKLVPLRQPQMDRFTAEEKATVDEVIEALWGKNATEVSQLSHEEIGWQIVEDGEDIPLSTAYLSKRPELSEHAAAHGQRLAASLGLGR